MYFFFPAWKYFLVWFHEPIQYSPKKFVWAERIEAAGHVLPAGLELIPYVLNRRGRRLVSKLLKLRKWSHVWRVYVRVLLLFTVPYRQTEPKPWQHDPWQPKKKKPTRLSKTYKTKHLFTNTIPSSSTLALKIHPQNNNVTILLCSERMKK